MSDADLQRCNNKLIPALPVTTQLTKQLTEQHGLQRKKSFVLSQRKASVDWSHSDLPPPPSDLTDGLHGCGDLFDGTKRRNTEPLYTEPYSPSLSRPSMSSPVPTSQDSVSHYSMTGCYTAMHHNTVPSSPQLGERHQVSSVTSPIYNDPTSCPHSTLQRATPLPPRIQMPSPPSQQQPPTPPPQQVPSMSPSPQVLLSSSSLPVSQGVSQAQLVRHYAEPSTNSVDTSQHQQMLSRPIYATTTQSHYNVPSQQNYHVVGSHGDLVQVVPLSQYTECSTNSPQLHHTALYVAPQHQLNHQQACISPQSLRRKTIGADTGPPLHRSVPVSGMGCTSPGIHKRSASLSGTYHPPPPQQQTQQQYGSPQYFHTPGSPKARVAPPPPRRSQNTRLSIPGDIPPPHVLSPHCESSVPSLPAATTQTPCKNRVESVVDGLTDPMDLPPPPDELLEGLPSRAGPASRPPIPPKRNHETNITSQKLHSKPYS